MMQMTKYIFYGSLMVFAIGVLSCADEEIPWETEESSEMLVVEGSFTNIRKHHRIILSKTADYFVNQKNPRVSGADVSITDGSTTYEFRELSEEPGVYESIDRVSGKANTTYTLNIRLQEPINGEILYQASEEMMSGIDLESMEAFIYENPLYVEQAPMDSVILLIYLYGHEPREINNFYTVGLYRNGNLLQDTVDEVEIYSDTEEFDGEYINSLFFFERFEGGDNVTVEISTVSKTYRQFIEGIQNITNQSGNPFDLSGPPANAIGNIEGGEALGYFRVSYVSRSKGIVQDRRKRETPD